MNSDSKSEMLPWTERYRPKKLEDVSGQEEIIKSLKAFVGVKNMPNLLFAGPPGVGKTTAALALSIDLFGDNYQGNFLELNASDERGIDVVRGRIKDFARSVSLGEAPFKLIFLDESDALTADAQHALRRTMESFTTATRFILSCNYSSKIIEPLQSRCAVFRFMPLQEADVKKMVTHVAGKEGLKIDEEAIKALFYISDGDMRRVLNTLQGCSLHSKKIDSELIHKISSKAKPKEIHEMVKLAIEGKFKEARTNLDKLIIHYGLSGEDVILQVYREVQNLEIDEKQKVELIDKIGEYDFRLVQGANERIQLEALLAQFVLLKK